ncbi:MAG: LysE family translocator [Alphaproteobacteria bacterium]|nr:LysE family translocator [Alphaproteobacteria bacterium]
MEEILYVIIFGLIVGIATSVPVGAMSLYCIKNTMNHSMKLGIVSGAAASLADMMYSIIAVFSIGWMQSFLMQYRIPIRMIGGLLIIGLGIKIFQTIPIPSKQVEDTESYSKCAMYSFFMTITNPMTFMAFTFIFSTFGLSSHLTNTMSPYLLVLSIYLGSILWWITLSLTIKHIKHRISKEFLVHINKGSAIILFILGAVSIISATIWWLF